MPNYGHLSLSVLKSNGLHRPENLPVKFGFSPKPIPTNIAKKLPPQRCSKSLFIPIFNFSHKRPTFAFTGDIRYTLGFRRKIAHKGTHGETGAFRTGALLLPSERSARFGNPAWPGGRTANFAAFGPWSGMLSKNAEGLRNSDAPMRVAVPRRRGPAGLRDPVVRPLMLRFSVSVRKVSAQFPANATRSPSHPKPSTHPAQFKESHTSAYTLKRVCP